MRDEIHRAAYRFQTEVESQARTVVGVNAFQEDSEGVSLQQPDYAALASRQRDKLTDLRARRDGHRVRAALDGIAQAARAGEALLPPIIDAVKALATLGEISDAFRREWGLYDSRVPRVPAGLPDA
jgi:methylmalonyl-CoA mutase N-terminal domain/subunit